MGRKVKCPRCKGPMMEMEFVHFCNWCKHAVVKDTIPDTIDQEEDLPVFFEVWERNNGT